MAQATCLGESRGRRACRPVGQGVQAGRLDHPAGCDALLHDVAGLRLAADDAHGWAEALQHAGAPCEPAMHSVNLCCGTVPWRQQQQAGWTAVALGGHQELRSCRVAHQLDTPSIAQQGWNCLVASAQRELRRDAPEMRPPPPTATKTESISSGPSCCSSSTASVPCPPATCGTLSLLPLRAHHSSCTGGLRCRHVSSSAVLHRAHAQACMHACQGAAQKQSSPCAPCSCTAQARRACTSL